MLQVYSEYTESILCGIYHPQPPTTAHNHPQQPTTTHNHPQAPSQNHRNQSKPPTTTQSHLQRPTKTKTAWRSSRNSYTMVPNANSLIAHLLMLSLALKLTIAFHERDANKDMQSLKGETESMMQSIVCLKTNKLMQHGLPKGLYGTQGRESDKAT